MKTVRRKEWNTRGIPISKTALLINIVFVLVVMLALLALSQLLISFAGELEGDIFSLQHWPNIIYGSLGVVCLGWILSLVLGWRNRTYVLKAGIYKVIGDFVDQQTGKVIVEQGLLGKQTRIYPATAFRRTAVEKGILGRIFKYGDILLLPELGSSGRHLRLKNVQDPERHLLVIQGMLDSAHGEDNQLG